ncbi:MAG: VCBS repeat-containing protein [Bdellovibrionota bacterium]
MKVRTGFSKRFLSLAAGLLLSATGLSATAHAAPAQGDFNGDGISDLSVALVDKRAKSTAWLTRLTQRDSSYFWTFGVPGDALITGQFYPDHRTYPGVVWVRDAKLPLEWYIKTPSGGEVGMKYGLPGDTIVNQGDFDGDGITDILTIRNGSGTYAGYRLWYVALSSQPGLVAQDVFGLISDRVGVADLDGDGKVEMVALRDGYLWFGKKFGLPEISQVQWGLPGDIPLMPLDINNDGKADYIVSRPTGAGQKIYVRYSASAYDIFVAGQDTSVPMTGNFVGAPSFAWAQRDTGFTAILGFDRKPQVFQFGIAANAIIRPDGTVVQPSDSGRFGTVPKPPTANPNPSNPSGPTGDGHCDEFRDNRDGGGKFKWNSANSKKTGKVMPTSDLTGDISGVRYYGPGGVLFDTFSFGGYEYGSRERWYGKKGIGSYPDGGYILVETRHQGQVCWEIPDPQRNWD